MVSPNSNTTDPEKTHGNGTTDGQSPAKRALSVLSERAPDGTIAALVGGFLLANAVRTVRRDRRRAGLFALGGAVLVGLGLRQRGLMPEVSAGGGASAGEAESTEARVNRERADTEHASEEPDVEAETGSDEGHVQSTAARETADSEPEATLHDEDDPGLHEEGDADASDDHGGVEASEFGVPEEGSEAAEPGEEDGETRGAGDESETDDERA